MVAASKLVIRYARYRGGANRLIDLLKGSLIKDDPDAAQRMLMSAFDLVQRAETMDLEDGDGPYELSQLAAEEDLETNWVASPLKNLIVDIATTLELRSKGVVTDHHRHLFTLVAKNVADFFKIEGEIPKDGKLPDPVIQQRPRRTEEEKQLNDLGSGEQEVAQTGREASRKHWIKYEKAMTMLANWDKIEKCPDISNEDKMVAVNKLPYEAKAVGLNLPKAIKGGTAVADAANTPGRCSHSEHAKIRFTNDYVVS